MHYSQAQSELPLCLACRIEDQTMSSAGPSQTPPGYASSSARADQAAPRSNDQIPPVTISYAPLEPLPTSPMYPPKRMMSSNTAASSSQSSLPLVDKHTAGNENIPLQSYDPERTPPTGLPQTWDPFSGAKRFEQSYEEFDTRRAADPHLVFAQGDAPTDKLSKLYYYLLNVSIVTRWIIFIVPILGAIWIPGILSITKFPNATVWEVRLIWWSIWLTVVWAGWWVAVAAARLFPVILRATIGVVAVETRRYIDWASVLSRYCALFAWSLAIWISWNPLIDNRQQPTADTDRSVHIIDLLGRLLFSIFLCCAILLFEKFSIQWIAGKFHERSYAERIVDQKFAVQTLIVLYQNSSDTGRSDAFGPGSSKATGYISPKKLFKRAVKGVRTAATTTTTAFGNVASEILGSSILQPNSPQAMVKTALDSANKSRLLARRLFYSFRKPNAEAIELADIMQYFATKETAERAFRLFDKDDNGDVTKEEMELACIDFHREQLSIEHSMQDLDSAVGRLDNILMSLFVVVAVLIIAVALEAQFSTLIASAGTLVLGLSWLIGSSLGEVLTSIIFLFIKHPFDVGDRIDLNKVPYTVKEIYLLSTVLLDSNSVYIHAPNTMLNAMFISNVRRSPMMSESFTFDVSYSTSFEDLEKLRDKMLVFLQANARDYQIVFDVAVVDFPSQEKMTLSADIKYKSNAQQGALKAKRRNKWICALKSALAEVKIYGPSGDPNAESGPTKYTEVPWKDVQEQERRAAREKGHEVETPVPAGGWRLADKNAALLDDSDAVYGESSELHMPTPRRNLSEATQVSSTPGAVTGVIPPNPPMQQQPGYKMMPWLLRHSIRLTEVLGSPNHRWRQPIQSLD